MCKSDTTVKPQRGNEYREKQRVSKAKTNNKRGESRELALKLKLLQNMALGL